jgi:hypothetical protein
MLTTPVHPQHPLQIAALTHAIVTICSYRFHSVFDSFHRTEAFALYL